MLYNMRKHLTCGELYSISVEIYKCVQCPKAFLEVNNQACHTHLYMRYIPYKGRKCSRTFFNVSALWGITG
ncbi:unnamed protein product [Ixodes persulcatus]